MYRQYIRRMRRVQESKSHAQRVRIRGEELPDFACSDRWFNRMAASYFRLGDAAVNAYWIAWKDARREAVRRAATKRFPGINADRGRWFFDVYKTKG